MAYSTPSSPYSVTDILTYSVDIQTVSDYALGNFMLLSETESRTIALVAIFKIMMSTSFHCYYEALNLRCKKLATLKTCKTVYPFESVHSSCIHMKLKVKKTIFTDIFPFKFNKRKLTYACSFTVLLLTVCLQYSLKADMMYPTNTTSNFKNVPFCNSLPIFQLFVTHATTYCMGSGSSVEK